MYAVKYRPLNLFITRYAPPYTIKDRLSGDKIKRPSNTLFIKRMFTDNLGRARKYNCLGHVTNSIGTNKTNETWEIIELTVEVK